MSDYRSQEHVENDEERPCLHCLIVETIDDFLAEYPVAPDQPDAIDTNEIITALAKTMAEITSSQEAEARQEMIEQLMREIMSYDSEYREQDKLGPAGSGARH